jgi:glycerol-1-phosphate dehydrogenase [NAD(P)+]
MHGQRVDELRQAVADIGVDIRPQSMGLTWEDVDATLMGMRDFVRETDLPYGIRHDFEVDRQFLDRLQWIVGRS